ncbi:phosphoribosylglycinamide formyltransferase [Hazenella coriacea]|uniref:Phosphoribosylglycinamide formyltransferase n=1 Tax=Hazenella coriacea TaxID=1179467 RepID=A0A4R3L472_9BACL|nr:phosphoribosylglycinamide formyltransferase [Hazenella coriacea]TCS92787.1 phosphoribosylglycinamide formyltransferase-1 [Hazenella coriacea]
MSIAVFASGSGSNFEQLVCSSKGKEWPMSISILICDKPQAKVLERAERLGIPAVLIEPKQFSDKKAYEEAILQVLHQYRVKWIFLAGYLRIIGSTLLNAYSGRIVNIHPSLLPAFPGLHAIEQAYQYQVKLSGVTVHFVDEGLDTGPIIAQVPVPLYETDTLESFAQRIHQAEHQIYPEVAVQLLASSAHPSIQIK